MKSKSLALICLGLLAGFHLPAATSVWTNTAGGNWNMPANWDPNQVPASTDTVLITNDGTYTVSINVKTLNVASLTLGGGAGIQTLQSYPMTTGDTGVALTLTNGFIGNHGVLAMSSPGHETLLKGTVVVGSGGALNLNNTQVTAANVDVQAGGTLTTIGPAASRFYYLSRLTVRTNGALNLNVNFTTLGPITNAGTININAGTLGIQNGGNPATFYGGLVNEAGGVINLNTGSSGIAGVYTENYLINRGTIYAWDAGGTTINLTRFDNSQGTVWCKAGNLNLQEFNGAGNLDGIYQADAGAVFDLYATDSPGTSAGPSLQFLGAGQFHFQGGTLTLAADQLPANLQFIGGGGGTLVLGAELTHALSMGGGKLGGTSVVIGSGGILTVGTAGAVYANVPVEVKAGGRLDVQTLNITKTSSLTVSTSAVVNMTGNLTLQGPMVNAGTVNQTNGYFNVMNGTLGYLGGLINEREGIISFNFRGSSIGWSGNQGYLINRGTIVRSALADPMYQTGIKVATFTNEGTLSVQKGSIRVDDSFVMQPSSVLKVGLNSQTDFGKFYWDGGVLPLGGSLTVTFNNGYVPAVGTSFKVMDVFSPGTYSGNAFDSISTPGRFAATYATTGVTLKYLGMPPTPTFDVSPLQIACRTFRVRGSATDYDGNGTITNFTLLLDTNILASVAGRQAQTTVCYEFPGEVTFTARATDSMGLTGSTNLTITLVPLSPRVLDPIGFQTNGAFKLCMGDADGTNYQMLANADLNTTNWVVLGPMENTNGLWRYLDLTATNAAYRYYRAAQLP